MRGGTQMRRQKEVRRKWYVEETGVSIETLCGAGGSRTGNWHLRAAGNGWADGDGSAALE
jgi:hypothetical protein